MSDFDENDKTEKMQKRVSFAPELSQIQEYVDSEQKDTARTVRRKSRNVRKNLMSPRHQRYNDDEKQPNEGHDDEWRSQLFKRVTNLVTEVKKLRQETRSLMCDFSLLEFKFKRIRRLNDQVNEEKVKRLDNLNEVVYLNGLIDHLEIADRNMQYEPCYVIDGATASNSGTKV